MTLQDINNRKFDKALHGYKIDDVDAFVSEVASEFERIEQENSDLKHKMTILADKIQEYREAEESLKTALAAAQRMGDSVTLDARRQGEAIIADAREKAERAMNNVSLQILTERRKLEEVKRETQIFKGRLLSLYKSQITMLETIPGAEQNGEEPQND
ncbi:MAG: DivIVA domain-containing protein [Clostridia bacterium]|nr:DivIVA domain-containing protein [Clostridia bacterium]